jgi:hypothetical protein
MRPGTSQRIDTMTASKKSGLTPGSYWAALLALVLSAPAPMRGEEAEAHAGTLKAWEIYGSVRMENAYWQRYKWYEYRGGADRDGDGVVDSLFTLDTLPSTRLQSGLQNNSYFGVRGKGEKFGYGFEMGLGLFIQGVGLEGQTWDERNFSQNKRQSTLLRKIYGDWYINDRATLRIGQDWTPANFFISNQSFNSDAGLGYSGILYTGRRPLIKVSLGDDRASLAWKTEAALVRPDAAPLPGNSFGTSNGYLQQTEEKLPKFELAGELGYRRGSLEAKTKIVGGISRYDAVIYKEDEPTLKKDLRATIKSDLLGAYVDLRVWKLGAAFTYARGGNLASYGVWLGNPDASLNDPSMKMFYPSFSVMDSSGVAKMANATARLGGLVVSCYAFPWLTWEAGAGMVEADHEDPSIKSMRVLNAFERKAFYTNLQLTVANGHFLIVPEISYSDFGGFKKSRTQEAGGRWYSYGLKLELDV